MKLTFGSVVRDLALIICGVALGMFAVAAFVLAIDHRFDPDNKVYLFIFFSLMHAVGSYACFALLHNECGNA